MRAAVYMCMELLAILLLVDDDRVLGGVLLHLFESLVIVNGNLYYFIELVLDLRVEDVTHGVMEVLLGADHRVVGRALHGHHLFKAEGRLFLVSEVDFLWLPCHVHMIHFPDLFNFDDLQIL